MSDVPLPEDVALVAQLAQVAWYQTVSQAHTEIGGRTNLHLRCVNVAEPCTVRELARPGEQANEVKCVSNNVQTALFNREILVRRPNIIVVRAGVHKLCP